ncbi:dihydropteroate synthase [Moorena sp. SIO3H5]|uniref:dihydropteroate synthase n=1 Tax=Moorena sp. SIO3H5 TaxID=2607834 RepID=UPI0013B81A7A|nr:dihydropteroate synthase [Moorena sp. SIO3H5]NEO68470.1 dihydropteroate synthase [Moorena sp. SIO3H5]
MLSLKDLYEIYDKHQDSFDAKVEEFTIGNRFFNFNEKPAILGVINLSTDSAYKTSICYSSEQAINRAKVLTAQGADLVDIGSEATGATSARVDDFKQNSKLIPVIESLKKENVLTSIETYYPEVARECLRAGANVINLTGGENSQEIYKAVSEFDAGIIICYLQGKNAREIGEYKLTDDPYDYLAKEIETATKLGVKKIFIDPGMGFDYKNFDDKHKSLRIKYQIQTLLNSFRLRKLGFPICNILPSALEYFGEEFRSAEPFFAVLAALGKTDLLRTHEVPKIKAVLDTLSLF